MTISRPTVGQTVFYETDRRNGLVYYLPATVAVTRYSHPGDYPDGSHNPLPRPPEDFTVHLAVVTPGGQGSEPLDADGNVIPEKKGDPSARWKDAVSMRGGSGGYTELNVSYDPQGGPRTWRFAEEPGTV